MPEYNASIDIDEVLERPLTEISAADFLHALGTPQIGDLRPYIADKKKFELWIDEDPIIRLPLREILERIRLEKKKVELELPWNKEWLIDPPPELIDRVAVRVAERMANRPA
jgi:hypothetical protein